MMQRPGPSRAPRSAFEEQTGIPLDGHASAQEPGETFTPEQVQSAIRAFLEYGEQEHGKSQGGYFSGDGWAAVRLRWHLANFVSTPLVAAPAALEDAAHASIDSLFNALAVLAGLLEVAQRRLPDDTSPGAEAHADITRMTRIARGIVQDVIADLTKHV